jgi:hypothetical protein
VVISRHNKLSEQDNRQDEEQQEGGKDYRVTHG